MIAEIHRPVIPLNNFENIGAGKEIKIFPSGTFTAREHSVVFPVSSPQLTPRRLQSTLIRMPRASCFHFDECDLHGFRLLCVADKFFHDVSLTSSKNMVFSQNTGKSIIEEVDVSEYPTIYAKSRKFNNDYISNSIFLGSNEPSNFGSWMYRFLPKLLISKEHAANRSVFVYNHQAWMRDIIRLASPDAKIIPHWPELSYRIRDVLVPSLPTVEAFLRPEVQDFLSDLLQKIPDISDTPEKIYLSRRMQATKRPGFRVLENETELMERLSECGFVEFIPEEHSVAHQLAVISRAKVIICPGGSGLFGCLFSRAAEVIVDLEANGTWAHAHANILAASGRPFTMVEGQQVTEGGAPYGKVHQNWRIDVGTLLQGMRKMNVV